MSWYDDDVRNIKVLHGSTDITAKVLANTLTIENILCDGQLSFGSCNSARAQLTTIEDLNLTGETLTIQFGNDADGYANLGVFTVTYSSQKENSEEVTLTMYDVVKKFDTDISEWYNGLNFPMTLSAFRSALCSHIGVTVVSTTLVNDDMTVYETISPSKLNGMDMLRYIGEINGVFPHATSTGTLEWVSLGTTTNEIPLSASQGAKSYVHKTYNTAAISKLCIRSEDGDVGVAVGTGTNCYYVTANVLVYGLSSTDLTTIGTNLYNKIQGISYNPSELTMKANPELPMGAKVTFNNNIFYILKRSTKGLLFDTIKADGNQYLKEETSVRSEIEQLRGKSNVLTRSIEETQSTISDVESGLSTQITQTADTLQIQINELYAEVDGDINLYYTQETPTLLNYPAWDFTYNIPCNNTVQLADDLAFEYNDTYYKKNLRSIAYDETDNITYRFIKSSGQWIWQEVSNTETSLILSRLSQVEATAEEVSIEVQEVRADLTDGYYTKVQTDSAITTKSNDILIQVSGTYATQATTASIQLSVRTLQNTKLNKTDLISEINASADVITLTSNRLSITSDYFTLSANGSVTASNLTITGGKIQVSASGWIAPSYYEISQLSAYIQGRTTLTASQIAAYDVNGDGATNVFDWVALKNNLVLGRDMPTAYTYPTSNVSVSIDPSNPRKLINITATNSWSNSVNVYFGTDGMSTPKVEASMVETTFLNFRQDEFGLFTPAINGDVEFKDDVTFDSVIRQKQSMGSTTVTTYCVGGSTKTLLQWTGSRFAVYIGGTLKGYLNLSTT